MALTFSNLQRFDVGNQYKITGLVTFDSSYPTNGEPFNASDIDLNWIEDFQCDDSEGLTFDCDIATGGGSAYLKAYRGSAATSGAEAAHTHAVALDTGATGAGSAHTHGMAGAATDAEAAHTHAVALDGGASDAGSAHSHGVTGLSNANESAHTHAVTLDGGTSDAGAAHTHAFTGTALTTDTFTVSHDATPETAVVYWNSVDGVHGWLSSDCSADSASDYFQTAGGERVMVLDDSAGATVALALKYQVYFDEDASPVDSRLMMVNSVMGTDGFVRTSGGKLIRIVHNANAAVDGVALYFNDDGADATLRLNGNLPSTANVTTNATDDSFAAYDIASAGSNANESTHTHGPGTLSDAASGAGSAHTHTFAGTIDNESAHTHGPGTLADAASGVGSSHTHGVSGLTVANESAHTHGYGTLADAASGAGSSHTHSISAASLAEVANTTDLSAVAVNFTAYGR